MSLALGDISAKMLLCGMSEIFLPMFSSRTFMVSRLILKSFIHLEFIFVYVFVWSKENLTGVVSSSGTLQMCEKEESRF